ncbi:MAG: hypothetical protein MI863_24440 [Desulfobacterales bacterium]|nr:hypothetical protein [Desulfobacterales bacterium]
MNWKIVLSIITTVITLLAFGVPYGYEVLDERYQQAHDPIRIDNIKKIADVIFAYDEKVGHPPLSDLVKKQNKPFMVLIGHSSAEEDSFAELKALNKGAYFINSNQFEQILRKGLQQKIRLPRDPQKQATYAPNVYIYFIGETQFCVAAHLYNETDISEPYEWTGGTFHSHALCYAPKK